MRDLELHTLALVERAMALREDGGLVNEYVLAVVRLDEAKPLCVIKPLHCSRSHET